MMKGSYDETLRLLGLKQGVVLKKWNGIWRALAETGKL